MIHKGRSSRDYASYHETLLYFAQEQGHRGLKWYPGDPLGVISACELIRSPNPPEWFLRDDEERFRKGFYHGYDEAVRHVVYLKKSGFLRPAEIANILYEFSETCIRKWWKSVFRDDHTSGGYRCRTPQFKHDSWWNIRQLVFNRDGNRCLLCGADAKLEADHVVPVCEGGLPTPDNLQTLCKQCHRGGEGSE